MSFVDHRFRFLSLPPLGFSIQRVFRLNPFHEGPRMIFMDLLDVPAVVWNLRISILIQSSGVGVSSVTSPLPPFSSPRTSSPFSGADQRHSAYVNRLVFVTENSAGMKGIICAWSWSSTTVESYRRAFDCKYCVERTV